MQGSHYGHVTSLPERRITFYFFYHHSEVVVPTIYCFICWENMKLRGGYGDWQNFEKRKVGNATLLCNFLRLAIGTLTTSSLFYKM